MTKPMLIIQPASSYDDLPDLCAEYGDEVAWFSRACDLTQDQLISVRVDKGEPLPHPGDICGAIITGALAMVTDDDPWIKTLSDWILFAIDAELPMLGVCFGHHLMAQALGGVVGANPNGASFGNVQVTRTNLSAPDPLFDAFPHEVGMKVFHYQSVHRPPKGATVLARGENDPYYAMRFAPCAWGVQFHPEFDNCIMDRTCDVYASDMTSAGYDVAELRARNTDDGTGRALLRRFATLVRQKTFQNHGANSRGFMEPTKNA